MSKQKSETFDFGAGAAKRGRPQKAVKNPECEIEEEPESQLSLTAGFGGMGVDDDGALPSPLSRKSSRGSAKSLSRQNSGDKYYSL